MLPVFEMQFKVNAQGIRFILLCLEMRDILYEQVGQKKRKTDIKTRES